MEKIKNKISEIYKTEQFKYFFKNSSLTFFGYFVTALFTFIITYFMANHLSIETNGVYRYVYAWYPLFAYLALGGIGTSLAKSISNGYDATLQFAIKLKLKFNLISILTGIIFAAYYYTKNNIELALGFFVLAISVSIFELGTLVQVYSQGKKNFIDFTKYTIVSKSLVLVLSLIAIFYLPFVWAIILLSVGIVGIIQLFYAYHLYNNQKKIDKKNILEGKTIKDEKCNQIDPGFYKYSIHLTIVTFIYLIGSQVDKFIVFKQFGSLASAGYWIATIFPLEFQRLIASITTIYFPKLVKSEKGEIKGKLIKILSIATFGTFIISIIYYFVSPILFTYIFPKYLDYLHLSQIAFFMICTVPFAFIWNYFIAKANLKVLYTLYITDPIVQIILYFLLVPTFEIYGLIYAMILKNIIFNIAAIYLFFKKE